MCCDVPCKWIVNGLPACLLYTSACDDLSFWRNEDARVLECGKKVKTHKTVPRPPRIASHRAIVETNF